MHSRSFVGDSECLTFVFWCRKSTLSSYTPKHLHARSNWATWSPFVATFITVWSFIHWVFKEAKLWASIIALGRQLSSNSCRFRHYCSGCCCQDVYFWCRYFSLTPPWCGGNVMVTVMALAQQDLAMNQHCWFAMSPTNAGFEFIVPSRAWFNIIPDSHCKYSTFVALLHLLQSCLWLAAINVRGLILRLNHKNPGTNSKWHSSRFT